MTDNAMDSKPWYDSMHPHGRPNYLAGPNTDEVILGRDPVKVGAVALRNSGGQLLVGFNKKRQVWDLPQGVVEDGEEPVTAAIRELMEETGVALGADDLVLVADIRHLTHQFCGSFRNFIFTTRTPLRSFCDAHNAEPDKCDGLYWMAPCQLPYPRGLSLRTYLAIAGLSN